MTFTVSPWWVWAVLSLALFGVVFWWRVARSAARDLRLWWHGWRAGVTEAPWQRVWGWLVRDHVTPLLEDCDHEYTLNEEETYEWCQKCDSIRPLALPPERSREELGFTGELPHVGIVVQESGDGWRSDAPDHRRPGWPVNGALTAARERRPPIQIGEDMSWWTPGRERRAPWWEAEHRAAYESLGFDYPSGLMARVREAVP